MSTPTAHDRTACCCGGGGGAVYTVCAVVAFCGGTAPFASSPTGTTITVTDGGGFTGTCTIAGSSCCVTVPSSGTYTVTAVTPFGQTQSVVVGVPVGTGTGATSTASFTFYTFFAATAGAVGLCPGDTFGSASFSFSGFATGPVTSTGPGGAVLRPTANPGPSDTVTVSATWRGRTQTRTINRCQTAAFTFVGGLNYAACGCGLPQEGATITVSGPAAGSAVTNSSGAACIPFTTAGLVGDTITVTTSKPPRFQDVSTTGIVGINPFTGGTQYTPSTVTPSDSTPGCGSGVYQMKAAEGYVCCVCREPLKKSMIYSDPLGSISLTYDDMTAAWYGCDSRTPSGITNRFIPNCCGPGCGCPCCTVGAVLGPVPFAVSMNCFGPAAGWGVFACNCGTAVLPEADHNCGEHPSASGGLNGQVGIDSTVTCPPTFELSGSFYCATPVSYVPTCGYFYGVTGPSHPIPWTITEAP